MKLAAISLSVNQEHGNMSKLTTIILALVIGITLAGTITYARISNPTATNNTTVTLANLIADSATATSTFAGGITFETSGFVYDISSNNVGIATTEASEKLEVVGNVLISGSNSLYFNDSGVKISIPAANIISFDTSATERMRIDTNGLVGIGATSPFAILSVESGSGTSTIANGSQAKPSCFQVYSAGGVAVKLTFTDAGATLSELGHCTDI